MTEKQKAHIFIPREDVHIAPLERVRECFSDAGVKIIHSVTLDVPDQTPLNEQEGILISIFYEEARSLNNVEFTSTELAQSVIDIFYDQFPGEMNKSTIADLDSSAIAKNKNFGDTAGIFTPEFSP